MFRNLIALIAASRVVRMTLPTKGDIPVLAISSGEKIVVTLPVNPDTSMNGTQSMFFANRSGHLVVKPLARSGTRTRDFEVIRSYSDLPGAGERVWLSGWLGTVPEDFGIDQYEELSMPNGTKAWLIPGGSDWIISVHGRKANRGECLRVAPLLNNLGFSNLIISHETDKPPAGLGIRRSNLGLTEWKEVESAVAFAIKNGAKSVTLYGWSLGSLFIGEYLKRKSPEVQIAKVIFDSPLLDFPSTIRLQSMNAGYSPEFGALVLEKLKSSLILRILDLRRKEAPDLIHNLNTPCLVFYSQLDGYVSMSRIDEFQSSNTNAHLEHFVGARHCRLYNQDSVRYEKAISDFLRA